MINLNYPELLTTIRDHIVPEKRTESAAFLIWYLENYYRLGTLEAVDSVCDQSGDKGVDGIYVNENENCIDIFQAKISQNSNSTIGDRTLKEFFGTLSQFQTKETIERLIQSAGDAEVVKLIHRLNLLNILDAYKVRGVFVTNSEIDANGIAYLESIENIVFVGKSKLAETYIATIRDIPDDRIAKFDITGHQTAEYIVNSTTKMLIAPISASELVRLEGIADQSIFALNVRGALGRTQVNKDIVASIKDPRTHKIFPLFHNGITMICSEVTIAEDQIEIKKYFVVNGCQSLSSLFENQSHLTDDLRIMTRFIQIDITSSLSELITKNSNNQNGVKARDFKSNNIIQIRLQNEIKRLYGNEFFYEIKRGEPANGQTVISNEFVGLCLLAFDLKEPWSTHRAYPVFEDKYLDLFGRPEVNAHRIVMVYLLMNTIIEASDKIDNKLIGKYILTRFMMLSVVRHILEQDPCGHQLLSNPEPFVKDIEKRTKLLACISKLIDDILIDMNAEFNDLGDSFDYRAALRDADWVKTLTRSLSTSYSKLVNRNRISSFKDEWESP